MNNLIGGLTTMVVFLVSAGVAVYLLTLAMRLVKAAERIATAVEHNTAYVYANLSQRLGSTDPEVGTLST